MNIKDFLTKDEANEIIERIIIVMEEWLQTDNLMRYFVGDAYNVQRTEDGIMSLDEFESIPTEHPYQTIDGVLYLSIHDTLKSHLTYVKTIVTWLE